MLKTKTTIDEMIKLLESKNIKFKLISKKEAKDYSKMFINFEWKLKKRSEEHTSELQSQR